MPDIKEKLVELMEKFLLRHFAEEIADHLIANGVTIQQDQFREVTKMIGWISVEERLPTEDDGDAVGAVLAIHKAAKKKYWHWGNVAENPYDFTCWMPLPEPPKGE